MLIIKTILLVLSVLVTIGLLLTLFMVVRKLLTNKGFKWTVEDIIKFYEEYGCSVILENGNVSGFTYDKE